MGLLIVRERAEGGRVKTWKVENTKKVFSWGRSSRADLLSINPESPSFIGFFEHRNDSWYLNFFEPQKQSQLPIEVCLNKKYQFQMNGYQIEIEYIESTIKLYDSLKKMRAPNAGEDCMQMAVVFSAEGIVISSHVEQMNKTFKIPTPDGQLEIADAQPQYKEIKNTHYTVGYRLVAKEDLKQIIQFQLDMNSDPESKRIYMASFAVILVMALVAVISMRNHTKEIAMAPTLPKASAPLEFKMTKTEFKKVEQMKKVEEATSPNSNAKVASGGGKKTRSVFSANSLSRLSTLVSKVSSQAARTKNIVVNTNGASAGSAPTGRALASLGNTNKDGKNWGSDSKEGEFGVGTIGKGGTGVGGFGSLNGGKAGKAGIGLIEDESEITGGLDREVIAQYIKSQLGQILYCYERQLSANPDLFGKVAVRFTISGNGHVEEQKIGDTTLKNKTVESCILGKVSKWKFPEPKGGTKVLVTYPFMFRSTN